MKTHEITPGTRTCPTFRPMRAFSVVLRQWCLVHTRDLSRRFARRTMPPAAGSPLRPVREPGAAGVADRRRGVALVRAVGDAGHHRAAGRVGRLEYVRGGRRPVEGGAAAERVARDLR